MISLSILLGIIFIYSTWDAWVNSGRNWDNFNTLNASTFFTCIFSTIFLITLVVAFWVVVVFLMIKFLP